MSSRRIRLRLRFAKKEGSQYAAKWWLRTEILLRKAQAQAERKAQNDKTFDIHNRAEE